MVEEGFGEDHRETSQEESSEEAVLLPTAPREPSGTHNVWINGYYRMTKSCEKTELRSETRAEVKMRVPEILGSSSLMVGS